MSAPKQTIGLCMIVRDEEEVIARCIESVRPLISSWTIVDTGSTDETAELVQELLGDLPGELHHSDWVDFGTNRSELMRLATGSADYLLLIDADMTIEALVPIGPLTADAYLLPHAGTFAYSVHRLVRGDWRWRFHGRTHEYLAADEEFSVERLESLVVHHHADGGSRADKLQRDAELLARDLRDQPGDPRSTFYLAQTQRDLGRLDEAAELYGIRADAGGWDEEAFYARFQQGTLLARLGRDAEATAALIAAHRQRPSRAEPLVELARLCRASGRHLAAYRFARRGLALPVPDDLLFVHRDAYEWELLEELAIAAYWIGEPGQALDACDRLLEEGLLPESMREHVESNRRLCLDAAVTRGLASDDADRVSALAALIPAIRFAELRLEVEPDWPRLNPSIVARAGGFLSTVRTANYRVLPDHRYESLSEDGRIRTLNYLADLGPDLRLEAVRPLVDADPGPRRPEAAILGYEDVRLIATPAGLWGIATVADRNPEGRLEMALLRIDGDRVTEARVLPGPDPQRHERNWMPFLRDERLHLVYSLGPTKVYECDPESAALTLVSERPAPAWAAGLRGGSQGVEVPGGTLFCVHEVLFAPKGRHYVHRFALLDSDLRLSALSPRFTFADERLEFCAGLAPHGDDLVISFGVADSHAGLATISQHDILALMTPVAH